MTSGGGGIKAERKQIPKGKRLNGAKGLAPMGSEAMLRAMSGTRGQSRRIFAIVAIQCAEYVCGACKRRGGGSWLGTATSEQKEGQCQELPK